MGSCEIKTGSTCSYSKTEEPGPSPKGITGNRTAMVQITLSLTFMGSSKGQFLGSALCNLHRLSPRLWLALLLCCCAPGGRPSVPASPKSWGPLQQLGYASQTASPGNFIPATQRQDPTALWPSCLQNSTTWLTYNTKLSCQHEV